MPYPSQITAEAVLLKAREMIEQDGVDGLSLHRLAAALGVKAPSLYRYYPSKIDLLRVVNQQTTRELVAAMRRAAESSSKPKGRVRAMMSAYRAYAHAHPALYGLAFTNTVTDLRADPAEAEQLALPLQEAIAAVSGKSRALAALRGAWALAHGFVMLELSGQFRQKGDLDAAFAEAVEAYIAGWRK